MGQLLARISAPTSPARELRWRKRATVNRLRSVPRRSRHLRVASVAQSVEQRLTRPIVVGITWASITITRNAVGRLRHRRRSGASTAQEACKPGRRRATPQGSQEGGSLLGDCALALRLHFALRLGLESRRAACSSQLSLSWGRGHEPRKPRRSAANHLRRRLGRSLGLARWHLGALRRHARSAARARGALLATEQKPRPK